MTLPVFNADEFISPPAQGKIAYGFYGRRGGVSAPPYDSLNVGLGSGDNLDHVTENHKRILHRMGMEPRSLVTPYQIHSAHCVRITSNCDIREKREGDALVTDRSDIVIGVLTADCTPVLFYAYGENGPVIGAAHAGWRGAFGGVLENTIESLCTFRGVTPGHIHAAIGPTIAQKSYEVDEAFMNRFTESATDNQRFFSESPAPDKWQFDLPAYCEARLRAAGLSHVVQSGLDTYSNPDDFFSYRRSCHGGEKERYGRQISVIAVKND